MTANKEGAMAALAVLKRNGAESAIKYMGAKACRSKGGECQDGVTTVKRLGTPVELSRTMLPQEGTL